MSHTTFLPLGLVFLIVLIPTVHAAGDRIEMNWKRDSGDSWSTSELRTLEELTGFEVRQSPSPLSRFGGAADRDRREATGFFRTEKIDGRWWTIDPEGYPYIHMGLTSVRPARHQVSRALFEEKFGDTETWAVATTELMRELGFNEIGRWSRIEALNSVENRLPYTTSLMFMGDFGRKLEAVRPSYGHLRYPENAIPVFHEEFEKFAIDYAREHLAGLEEDPWLVGHFTDNELPVPRNLLERTLAVDPGDPVLGDNVKEAWRWFRERRGANVSADEVSEDDNLDWLGHVMDRYYEITTAAIRRFGPNHMNLGSRLHGAGPHIPQVVEAAGRHLDIVSINYYNIWQPADRHLQRWADHSDAPVIITEFYVKGEDAAEDFGLRNELGAGWIVPTQADRGRWYQGFTLRLLEAPHVAGWQYFKYSDEADDSNKGILDPHYDRFEPFTERMAPIHHNAYRLIDYFEEQ